MDIEDKITALSEPVDTKHKIELIFRTLDSTIGECSNCATAYHNKRPSCDESAKKYSNYICMLSVITGKSINLSVDYKFCEPRNLGCA